MVSGQTTRRLVPLLTMKILGGNMSFTVVFRVVTFFYSLTSGYAMNSVFQRVGRDPLGGSRSLYKGVAKSL